MSTEARSSQSSRSVPTRNPRRRQRKDSDELGGSLRQQPQRKKSKLSQETWNSSAEVQPNGELVPPQVNGHASDVALYRESSIASADAPLREKQQSGKGRRPPKDDGSVVLTSNDNYFVKKLPSFPVELQQQQGQESEYDASNKKWRGSLYSTTGHALALTHQEAFVWDYASANPHPPTRIFNLPFPARPNEPIPFGALVSGANSREIGLVVINASSGKISYWQNVENADALSLFEQRRNGMEGNVGNMLLGETIVALEIVQHAGFIIVFSSGRTAQLLLTDAQSRAAVHVRFLNGSESVGIFGSLKNIVRSGFTHKTVIGAKLVPSKSKRDMEVLIGSNDSTLQLWRVDWPGRTSLQSEINATETIQKEVDEYLRESSLPAATKIKTIDFAIPQDTTDFRGLRRDENGKDVLDITILIEIGHPSKCSYALVELELDGTTANAKRILPLHSSPAPEHIQTQWTPELHIPRPYHTAFIVFDNAVSLVSLSTISAGPEAQFQMDTDNIPTPFQSTFAFKKKQGHVVVGCSSESFRSSVASIVVFVTGVGLVRTQTEPFDEEHAIGRAKIDAKSHLEQAIFFGMQESNPLNLSAESNHSLSQIEDAALAISEEVLASRSKFIPEVASPMDPHLAKRAEALYRLALHLKNNYPQLSRPKKWALLFCAEKLAAARTIWKLFEASQVADSKRDKLLPEIIRYIEPERKTAPKDESEQADPVRLWFVRDITLVYLIIGLCHQVMRDLGKEKHVETMKAVLQQCSDADDIMIGGLKTAYDFRAVSLDLYGLQNEDVVDGVLQRNYQGLPEFWTSSEEFKIVGLPTSIERIAADYVKKKMQNKIAPNEYGEKVIREHRQLVQVYFKHRDERCLRLLDSHNDSEKAQGSEDKKVDLMQRFDLLSGFTDIRRFGDGMSLAEMYGDMDALVILVLEDLRHVLGEESELQDAVTDDPSHREDIAALKIAQQRRESLVRRINGYFQEYGPPFANAIYSRYIEVSTIFQLLSDSQNNKKYLTNFLRAEPSREKISWINDVNSERDYQEAGKTLLDVAISQEQNFWSKRVEVSLAKLALVASQDAENPKLTTPEWKLQQAEMDLVSIQDRVYRHVKTALYNAVDETAELELAMESFGQVNTKNTPALQKLLERGFAHLLGLSVMDVEQLLDVLTLMDERKCEEKQNDIAALEYFLALELLQHENLINDAERRDTLLKTVWRRCFLRDDWTTLNATAKKSDAKAREDVEGTMLFSTYYAGFKIGLWDLVPSLRPQDVLGAGTRPSDHAPRFHSADLCEPIARDNTVEDDLLQKHIKQHRLEHWVGIAREAANEKVRLDTERESKHDERRVEIANRMLQLGLEDGVGRP